MGRLCASGAVFSSDPGPEPAFTAQGHPKRPTDHRRTPPHPPAPAAHPPARRSCALCLKPPPRTEAAPGRPARRRPSAVDDGVPRLSARRVGLRLVGLRLGWCECVVGCSRFCCVAGQALGRQCPAPSLHTSRWNSAHYGGCWSASLWASLARMAGLQGFGASIWARRHRAARSSRTWRRWCWRVGSSSGGVTGFDLC